MNFESVFCINSGILIIRILVPGGAEVIGFKHMCLFNRSGLSIITADKIL